MIARRRLAAVSRGQWLAMGAVLAVGLAVRLVGLGDAGQTWDEDTNWAAGRNYITNLLDLDFSDAAWSWNFEHPPVMKLLAGIGAQFADGFGPARALSALWISLGCALLVPIGTRLFRFRVGVLAALIATLLPPMVAHGQIVGHESPTVLWWALGILLALGVHDYLPSDERGLRALRFRLAWIGVVIGVAIASRFVNGLLGPLCALIVVVQSLILVVLALISGADLAGGPLGVLVLIAGSILLGWSFGSLSNGLALIVRREETLIAAVNLVILPLTFPPRCSCSAASPPRGSRTSRRSTPWTGPSPGAARRWRGIRTGGSCSAARRCCSPSRCCARGSRRARFARTSAPCDESGGRRG